MNHEPIFRLNDSAARMLPNLVRLTLAIMLGFSIFAPMLHAQETKKLPRIGVLWPGDVKFWNDGFFAALREHGYVDAVTVHIDVRSAFDRFDLSPKLAEELVRLNPDVIFTVPGVFVKDILRALEKARKMIPIVVASYDPVAEGIVASARILAATLQG